MSDWIHCNKCFKQPVPNGPKFHLTNCGHFICELCTAGNNYNIFYMHYVAFFILQENQDIVSNVNQVARP